MRAARLHEYGHPLVLEDIPTPRPARGQVVVRVVGAGFCHSLKILKLLSGAPIIAVDVSDDKLRLARELGVAHALNGTDPQLAPHIRDLTHGRGVAAAFDFVGSESTLSLAVSATRSLGKVSQVGLAGGAARMKVLENTRFEVLFEATLWGTVKELREVIALAESGRLTSIPIEVEPLDRINEVYARLKRGDVKGRAVIQPAA